MNLSRRPIRRRSYTGFSMVEVLVAVLIGLITSVIIAQVLTKSEAGRRSVSGVVDSQSSGQVALFMLERDLAQAGQGLLIDYSAFTNQLSLRADDYPMPANCTVHSSMPFNGLKLLPIVIIPSGTGSNIWRIPAGDAGSDMIGIAYATPSQMTEGVVMAPNASPAPPVYYAAPAGINVGVGEQDLMLATQDADCTMGIALSYETAGPSVTLDYSDPGVAYNAKAILYNLGPFRINGAPVDANSAYAGHRPRVAVYAVRSGVLTVCDFLANGGTDCTDASKVSDPTVWMPVAEGVVGLQAQYGWETTSPVPDGVTDVFCKTRLGAAGTCPNPDIPTPANAALQSACDATRVNAVKIALIARSSQFDKNVVSPPTVKLWADTTVQPTTVGPNFAVPDRHYRYRVFQSTVALRAAISLGAAGSTLSTPTPLKTRTGQCY